MALILDGLSKADRAILTFFNDHPDVRHYAKYYAGDSQEWPQPREGETQDDANKRLLLEIAKAGCPMPPADTRLTLDHFYLLGVRTITVKSEA